MIIQRNPTCRSGLPEPSPAERLNAKEEIAPLQTAFQRHPFRICHGKKNEAGLTASKDDVKLYADYNDLLANESLRYELIAGELQELKDKYADERRTRIVKMATEFNPEDMYADDDMVITISHLGRLPSAGSWRHRLQGKQHT